MSDLSIFKLDSQTITIKDTTARQTAESAKTLAKAAATASNDVREQITELKIGLDKLNEGGLNLKDEVIEEGIHKWLDEHPEATTTVQDGSITEKKINTDFLLYIEKDYVTPKMFGAVGDGVTDDTEAFFNAIRTKKTVLITSGTYYLTSFDVSDIAYDGMKIISDNAIIHCATGFIMDRNFGRRLGFILKGLNIIGSNENNSIGIKVHSGAPAIIEKCSISNFNIGIQLTETYDGHIYDSKIINCTVGVFYNKLTYANSVNAFIMKKCSIVNATTGIKTMVGANNSFDHVTFKNCNTCFLLNDSPFNYCIKECYTEGHKSFVKANNSSYSSNINIINNFLGFMDDEPDFYLIDLRNCTGLVVSGNICTSDKNYFIRCIDDCDGVISNNVLRRVRGNSLHKSLYNGNLPIYYSNCNNLSIFGMTDTVPLISALDKSMTDFYNPDGTKFVLTKSVLGVNCYTPDNSKSCALDVTITESGWYTATFLIKTAESSLIGIRNANNWDKAVTNTIESPNLYSRHIVTRYFNTGDVARIYVRGISSYGFLGLSKNNCNGLLKDFYL